ncbi:hypothetical protein K4F52_009261 [Lecanicillium sp. MT-2017a]|nr:hypothetical protein K4F52_009261 [Lecanicillium sp. MT-2017a]
MAAAQGSTSIESLEPIVKSSIALTQKLSTILAEIYTKPDGPSTEESTPPIDALALVRDAANLIRSHATKFSLLLINEPFTPSAIATVIRELVSGPIPALTSAVQACQPSLHTALFRKELAWRAKRVLVELGSLLSKVPKDGKVLSGADRDAFRPGDKGSMAATGLLWSACDNVMSLVNMGVGGFFVHKVEEWRDTLKDVMLELKEWGEEEEEDDDDEDQDDSHAYVHENSTDDDAQSTFSAQDVIDELMSSGNTIPRNDPDGIRPRLESSIRRIRLVVLLYQAIVKRRLKKLPTLPSSGPSNVPQRLDEAALVLCKLPDEFGELASAFYDMESGPIDEAMDQCFFSAFAAGELLTDSWDGARDEFSEWTGTFKVEIKKS